MNLNTATPPVARQGRASQPWWAGVVLACFLMQQLLAPLHCFLHEHELEAASRHVHAAVQCPDMHGLEHRHHDGHEDAHEGHASHAPEATDASSASDEHPPHPVEDHLSKQVERLVLRTSIDPPVIAWIAANPAAPPTLTARPLECALAPSIRTLLLGTGPPPRGPPKAFETCPRA